MCGLINVLFNHSSFEALAKQRKQFDKWKLRAEGTGTVRYVINARTLCRNGSSHAKLFGESYSYLEPVTNADRYSIKSVPVIEAINHSYD